MMYYSGYPDSTDIELITSLQGFNVHHITSPIELMFYYTIYLGLYSCFPIFQFFSPSDAEV